MTMNLLVRAASEGVEGKLHCVELQKLMELATDREVLEIGAYAGLSAWGMAQTAKSVVSIDTFKACTNGQDQMPDLTTLEAYKRAVSRFNNVTWYACTSEAAVPILAGRMFDLIFLDAMHRYIEVKADMKRWWPFLRMGGTLALHDYRHPDWPDVKKAADERFGRPHWRRVLFSLRWITKKEANS